MVTDNAATPGVKSFQCPACGGAITLRAGSQSLTVACSHCSSVIDTADENYQIVATSKMKERPTLLEMGLRGTLFGTKWEVIGYTEKCDSSGDYHWDEYLLFNPYAGYRFLVQNQGHWNFVEMVKEELPSYAGRVSTYQSEGLTYKLFLSDSSRVLYVKGEFYWKVRKDDTVKEVDYICPPYVLTIEGSGQDIVVSKGTYVEPSVIQEAFGLNSADMPRRIGVAMNQPSSYQGNGKAWGLFILATALALALYIVFLGLADKEKLAQDSRYFTYADKNRTYSTPSFTVKKTSNILIHTFSQVSNNWTEVAYTLVNDETQKTYDMLTSVEYYFGTDSDGAWSEGGTSSRDYIASAVPAGTYHLLYEVDSGYMTSVYGGTNSVLTGFEVIRDVASGGNLIWTFLLLLAFPLFTSLRQGSFESKRWSQSDMGVNS